MISFVCHLQEAALACDKLLVQDASDFLVETVIIKMVRIFVYTFVLSRMCIRH